MFPVEIGTIPMFLFLKCISVLGIYGLSNLILPLSISSLAALALRSYGPHPDVPYGVRF